MSMLTSLCDRLHATARTLRERCASEGIYFPTVHDAANDLESAAETILDLRNRCHDLQRENAKMRALIQDMRWAMANGRDERWVIAEYDKRMRELGIEV